MGIEPLDNPRENCSICTQLAMETPERDGTHEAECTHALEDKRPISFGHSCGTLSRLLSCTICHSGKKNTPVSLGLASTCREAWPESAVFQMVRVDIVLNLRVSFRLVCVFASRGPSVHLML